MKFTGKGLRWLDLDCEARPLSWLGGDFVTKEVTAIACQFVGEKKTYCWALGECSTEEMLSGFLGLYTRADGVTGHFLRGYDLPVLNAAMIEHGLPPLIAKLSHDTKIDLLRFQGISKSQESLGAMLGLMHPKVQMSQSDWRAANRLTPAGIRKTKQRVVGDVHQHIEMRAELLRRGLLAPPKVWRPAAAGTPAYQA